MVALDPAIVAVVHHVAQPFQLLTLELNVPTHHSQQLYKSTHTSLPPSITHSAPFQFPAPSSSPILSLHDIVPIKFS
jgi:hypothetical protein